MPVKAVALEVRPTYHQLDQRIEAHVFLCMLALYVQWHMQRKLAPLFETNGAGRNRRWTWSGVLERLKGVRRQRVKLHGATAAIISRPDEEQKRLLDLLEVAQ